jgi:hypothetical protein
VRPTPELTADEEIKAVQIMSAALKQVPNSYPVLLTQVDFLLSKGKADWARQVAQQAVNSAPSEFTTWAKLAEAHIALGEFDKALLALNSCPMFTFNERDLHRMPTPRHSHLPTKKFIADSGLIDEESARDNEADVALLRLPAPGLRGTFAKAYELLTLLVSKIGWDELLKTRSSVFVMEEEYRAHRTGASVDVREDREENGHADEDASTRGLSSPRASHEEDANGDSDGIEKPPASHAVADEDEGVTAESFEGSAFANKRLCDRWLDNLFLVLYEDLRVYTIWRAEVSHFQLQHMSYRKTGTEVGRASGASPVNVS